MVDLFWKHFWASLGGTLFFSLLLIGTVFYIIRYKSKYITMFFCGCVFLFIVAVMVSKFIACCKDYTYAKNDTYIEENAFVAEIKISKTRFDKETNRFAKMHLLDSNEYIYFDIEGVTVGKTYIIRYYPHTKICEVVEEVQ